MKKIILLTFISFLLIGCATTVRKVQVVKVPVVSCPVPERIKQPILPIDLLSDKDVGNWRKIAESYAITIIKLESYTNSLEEQLEIYRSENGEILNGAANIKK